MYFPLTESEQKFISNIFSQYVIACLMNERAELCWESVVDIIFVGKASAVVDFRGLKMQNFDGEYLQVIERAS